MADLRYYKLYKNYNNNNYVSYLSPYYLNLYYHKENSINKTFNYIYSRFSNIEVLLSDWKAGLREIIFSKIMRITNIDYDYSLEKSLIQRHEDCLQDSLLELFLDKNYIHTKNTSYYTYIINIIPFIYSKYFNRYLLKDQKYINKLPILYYHPEPNIEILSLFKKIN